ncbi:BQ5605_C032g11082 [Microbotryum silenes-dioicae]|uniref:BQ5605_C032g11082 protein n=1 Tax=Microbotryum silenes-dioicae TaxID=796604 RepID=A0A2X0MHI4_9BASI|nr:BQ5605_C032g11082 [Microbotryum silenes-dioicae]
MLMLQYQDEQIWLCIDLNSCPLQGPWPMDQYPCSLDYINYHVNGVGMR